MYLGQVRSLPKTSREPERVIGEACSLLPHFWLGWLACAYGIHWMTVSFVFPSAKTCFPGFTDTGNPRSCIEVHWFQVMHLWSWICFHYVRLTGFFRFSSNFKNESTIESVIVETAGSRKNCGSPRLDTWHHVLQFTKIFCKMNAQDPFLRSTGRSFGWGRHWYIVNSSSWSIKYKKERQHYAIATICRVTFSVEMTRDALRPIVGLLSAHLLQVLLASDI